jgi:hypothetical protein
MATRKHSIRVPVNFGAVADLANNTLTTIGTPTIFIPENNSAAVTFTSVLLYTGIQDTSTATGATITTYSVSVTLAPAAASTVAVATATLANTGENWGGIVGPIDYTTYFNTNYGAIGTVSKAATVAVQSNITTGTGVTTRGVFGYFEITYTFDDAQATRIQTICIPYESGLSTLTTTINTTFCTIPQLTGVGGILAGYAGVTIRNRWMEVRGNSNVTAIGDITLSFRFDTGGTINFPARACALNGPTWQFYQADASALTTTATHTFQLWSNVAARFANIIVNEWVTFEYTVSGTTSVLNYVELAAEFSSPIPGTTNAVDLVIQRDLLINEPTTITFVKGALEVCCTIPTSASIAVSAGAQSAAGRTYVVPAPTANGASAMYSFQHGLDSSSALGAALTLARGENAITISLWRSAGSVYNTNGTIKILYSSGVASGGVDTHNRACWELARSMNFTAQTDDTVTGESFQIPETSYWLNAAGFKYLMWNTAATNFLTSQVRVLAGETPGDGWRDLYSDFLSSGTNAELGYYEWSVRGRDEFKNYPQDQDTSQMDIETARNLRSTAVTGIRFGVRWSVSYTAITFTVSGTISGSAGGTIGIDLFQITTGGDAVFFDQTSRTGNGTYTFDVYDDTLNYYVVAYESASLKGVSKEAVPAIDFDISLAGGSPAVTTGYAAG